MSKMDKLNVNEYTNPRLPSVRPVPTLHTHTNSHSLTLSHTLTLSHSVTAEYMGERMSRRALLAVACVV